MVASTRGSAMVATRRSRPPQAGHASTSRPKVRRNSSAQATWRPAPPPGGARGATGAGAPAGGGYAAGDGVAGGAGGPAGAGGERGSGRGAVAAATRQQPRAAKAPW